MHPLVISFSFFLFWVPDLLNLGSVPTYSQHMQLRSPCAGMQEEAAGEKPAEAVRQTRRANAKRKRPSTTLEDEGAV